MNGVGISIPDMLGIANFKPVSEYLVTYIVSPQLVSIESSSCPNSRIWCITHLLFGVRDFNANFIRGYIRFATGGIKNLVCWRSNVIESNMINLFGTFWLLPGDKFNFEYDMPETPAHCYLSISGIELAWTGEI